LKLRILFLNTHTGIRGPLPKIFPVIISAIKALGCEVITCPWGQEKDSETLVQKLFRGTLDLFSVSRVLRQNQFEILFINTAHDTRCFARDLPLLLLARLAGNQKTVILFHGSQAERLLDHRQKVFRLLTRCELSLSDAVFLLSTEEKRAWYHFRPKGEFYFVRLPRVDEPIFSGSTESSLGFSFQDNVPVLLFVGRLILEKGVLDLIKAMPLILSEMRCHLLIVGDGPAKFLAQQHVRGLGLEEHISFTEYLSGNELRLAYHRANVFVLPTYFPEGFPVVILEAMQAGLPIITTRIRGMADWLREPENALFVPAKDPERLAQRIVELLSDRGLMDSMSAANRKLIQTFEPMDVAREWLVALERVSAA
jgi:glycosyltransferase involved in cell wall biosynthesis